MIMRTFGYALIISALAVVLLSCANYDQRLIMKDLERTQIINLHKKSGQGNICSMGIRVSGQIDGKARIVLMLNKTPFKTTDIDGKTSFTWGGDWYADSMELRYEPLEVRSGELTIEYYFVDI
jgi:hypothetical protein